MQAEIIENAGLWQSGAAERAAEQAAHSRVPWKRAAWSVESCGIQKWLVSSLESHGKTKSLEKTGKTWHGEVEDVTSTDCIAAKDEEGGGGVCPPHQTQAPQWGNQVIP